MSTGDVGEDIHEPGKMDPALVERLAAVEVPAIRLQLREAHVLRLRATRMTFDRIAEQTGYADGSGAYKAFRRAMQATIQEPADELRRIELESLDQLYRSALPRALGGNMRAMENCLRIQERRARLVGLDAPQRRVVDVVTTDAMDRMLGEMLTEFQELDDVIAAAGEDE